ncbi:DUF7289 family protein [Halorarius litoreus]|uniref:DUF7289 family protein n=1 Tax=Halorarius litoreus TaxID=2962676 RepID=UPI0020CFC1B8|nr:hypothetical protein [Halorarius litoreus]
MSERGVSEILGFVLVFSLMAASVASVYVVGFSGLEDSRSAEQINNAERAFDVLDDNVDDLHQDRAPHRATEFKLYNAGMYLGEPTRITMTITNVGSAPTFGVTTYPLVYDPQDSATELVYTAGASIREDRGGAIFLDEPGLIFRESGGVRTASLPIVQTRSSDEEYASGTGTILVRGTRVVSETLVSRTTPTVDTGGSPRYSVDIVVETTPVRAELWEAYLDEEIEGAYGVSDPCDVPTGTSNVECTISVERLFFSATRIELNIED